MGQLQLIGDFVVETLSKCFDTLHLSWLGNIAIYLLVLDVVISLIILIRGTKS